MKRILAFFGCLILGPILGCLLSGFWAQGGNTFWKRIHYFPLPVEKIIIMDPFGSEFWVEANDTAIYHVVYPCRKEQTCWDKTEIIPAVEPFTGDYKVTDNKCENDDIAYPLFRKIRTCITSTVLAADANWQVSLALTENNELWIWQKPWDSPYNILAYMATSILSGAIIGFLLGTFLVWKIR